MDSIGSFDSTTTSKNQSELKKRAAVKSSSNSVTTTNATVAAAPEKRRPAAATMAEKSSTDINAPLASTSSAAPTRTNRKQFVSAVGVLALASIATRLYKIDEPAHVCWDETHFGKMANWYLNRTFFFDVHPPLGKMMIALAGHLSGYNGTHPFDKPGDPYDEYQYAGMRILCAVLGAMLPPFACVAVWNLTGIASAAFAAGVLLVCDTGMIALTQYVLLDAPLLFFIMLTCALSTRGYRLEHDYDDKAAPNTKQSFLQRTLFSESFKWWIIYILCGTSLACALAVKFVGLFVVIWAGSFTIARLWKILGRGNAWDIPIGLAYRALALIAVPVLVYCTIFAVHLHRLNRSGPGDGFYSSEFQSTLQGNPLGDAHMPLNLAYGSVVTIKSTKLGAGYLHSHPHLYPEGFGAQQQQITLYGHKDENNKWLVQKSDEQLPPDLYNNSALPVDLVKSGDRIRLMHVSTTRNLHSHRGVPAPVTRQYQQVTGYGEHGGGDANDIWRIYVDGGTVDGATNVRTLVSKIRLVHDLTDCSLYAGKKQLPKWGFEQLEVACNPRSRLWNDQNALWQLEDHEFQGGRLPNVSFHQLRPGLLSRIHESHMVMLQGNSNLKPKDNEVHSRPWHWPINLRGQWFSVNNAINFKVYMLGNPVIWWSNLALMAVYVGFEVWFGIRRKRGYVEPVPVRELVIDTCLPACRWLLWGWFIHFMPFFAMGRILYYHHYFPAHMFACMLSGVVLFMMLKVFQSYKTSKSNSERQDWLSHIYWGTWLAITVLSFSLFQALTYGWTGKLSHEMKPNETSPLSHLKWLSTWEF